MRQARGFESGVMAELLPAAEIGLVEGVRLTGQEGVREDPGRRGAP